MSSWVRRGFDGIGLTQSPPGPYLAALQAKYGGTVLLCIDVSGSMSGSPLRSAIAGGEEFLDEAARAHYHCGLVLWSDRVDSYLPARTPHHRLVARLRGASICGGTRLTPALELGIKDLGPLSGDRVMCVFSDGGLGDQAKARETAARACAMGIRIIVRGVGAAAAASLAELACPGERDDEQLIESTEGIQRGIASMATGLTNRSRGSTAR